jgi:hypothetical protein
MMRTESERLDSIEKKLDDVHKDGRAQLALLARIVDLFEDALAPQPTAAQRHEPAGRHLHLVREE